MKTINKLKLVAGLFVISQSLFAVAALDQNICKDLSDDNCVVQGDEAATEADKATVSMITKEDQTAETTTVALKKDKTKKFEIANGALARTLEFQRRSDDLTRRNVRDNDTIATSDLNITTLGTYNRRKK